ncbi:TIGR03089 family protein [Arthrobacter sp. 35W]|uniref:TIGR03089 family protein n=1 Tax=Arthrobacter sp. 35W TaxID=1132441 RepID=UPI001E4C0545|nr:TIGR03089 family protein [Arthrobacter sp. 35W]
MPAHISSPTDLLAALRRVDPTSPRLTWYGPSGERVELSGRVLDNWVAKTANLLCDELDVEPGSVVRLDLPPHWRTLCWALAGWAAGATVDLGAGLDPAVVATTDPAAWADAAAANNSFLAAVALPALQMRWDGELPEGAVDYASEVRAHGDVFTAFDAPHADTAAVATEEGSTSYAELMESYAEAGDGGRVLLRAGDGLDAVLRAALGIWSAGGSVVLLHPDVEATDHLVATEKITREGPRPH